MNRIVLWFLIAFAAICSQAAAATPSPVRRCRSGDIHGWHQIFTDNFSRAVPVGGYPSHENCGGTVYPASKWCPYPDGWTDTSDNGTYIALTGDRRNHDGVLDLYLHTEAGVRLVSAPAADPPRCSRPRRRATLRGGLRCQVPGQRRWSATRPPGFCGPTAECGRATGKSTFPRAGLRIPIGGFVHFRNGTSDSDQYAIHTGATYTSWHTAVIVWRPGVCALPPRRPDRGGDSDANPQQTDALGAPDRDQLPCRPRRPPATSGSTG